ncbi:hypothetical protein PHYBOEH_007352 [Phytophthora boehmeriae]|uniref:TKL protein kinase n=1 Tax=Phytophthora boehmeriae TaxID=109152 RepID=A0A8T1X370_9STRA|nr:hypothetical protein PHYBOEH_007352 [Phytophthora boehmeriae]
MSAESCPHACPAVPTLFSNCSTASSDVSTLWLAASSQLREEDSSGPSEEDACDQVTAVDASELGGLEIQAVDMKTSTLSILDVSNNPIANITAMSKRGPKILIARNTSLSSFEHVVFPSTLRQLTSELAELYST